MKKIIYILLASTLSVSLNAQVDRSKAPVGGPAKEISVGKSETFSLPNGLKVIVVQNTKLPRVQANLYFNHAPKAEGRLAGTASLLGTMVMAGTKNLEKEKLDEEIEFMGSSISVSEKSASFSTLKKNLNKTFELFADVVTNPAFTNQDELTKAKKQTKTGIESMEKNPDAVSARVANVLLYGENHPYGEYTTAEKIDGITMENIRNYYKNTFTPNKGILTITGDISKDEASSLVNKYFLSWTGQNDATPAVKYTTVAPKPTRIVLVDIPGSTQSVINILNTTNLKKANGDYFAAYVGNAILGTGMASRLFKNIREDKGWTYGAYSSISDDYYLNGEFSASAKVRNNVTDSAVVEFMKELNAIRTELATEEEIKLNKAQITGMFALGLEKPETVARFARNTQIEGLPQDFYNNFLKNINAVSSSSIKEAMTKYIDFNNMTILIVGKVEEILPALKNLGYPIEFVDKFGNIIEDPTAKKSAGDVKAIDVINKYVDAIGGTKALKKVKSISETYEVSITGAPVALQGAGKKMAPNKSDFQISMSGMAIMRQAFDGNEGFSEQMGQRVPLAGDELASAKAKKSLFDQLTYTPNMIELDGIVVVNGKDSYKIIVTENNEKSAEFYDVETGLLVKTESEKATPDGEKIFISNEYLNYKEVSGIKYPSKMIMSTGEQNITLEVITRIINKGVKASDFL